MEKQPHQEYRDELAQKLKEIRDAGPESEDPKSKITRAKAEGYLEAKKENKEYVDNKEYHKIAAQSRLEQYKILSKIWSEVEDEAKNIKSITDTEKVRCENDGIKIDVEGFEIFDKFYKALFVYVKKFNSEIEKIIPKGGVFGGVNIIEDYQPNPPGPFGARMGYNICQTVKIRGLNVFLANTQSKHGVTQEEYEEDHPLNNLIDQSVKIEDVFSMLDPKKCKFTAGFDNNGFGGLFITDSVGKIMRHYRPCEGSSYWSISKSSDTENFDDLYMGKGKIIKDEINTTGKESLTDFVESDIILRDLFDKINILSSHLSSKIRVIHFGDNHVTSLNKRFLKI